MTEKERAIEKAKQQATYYERTYHGCAQCVLAGVEDALGVPCPQVFKAATGLSAGIGCMGRTCGALIAGVLAIGIFVGRDRNQFDDPKRLHWDNYRLVRELVLRFEREFSTLTCRKIQEKVVGEAVDFWDPTAVKRFGELLDGHARCGERVVAKVAGWVVEMLIDYQQLNEEQYL